MPMIFACGEKAETANSGSGSTTEAEITEAPTPAPTPEPTTPEPTEPPTTREPFVVDSNLSYWDQIYSELEYYGLSGGTKILAGEDEAALMKGFSGGGTKKEEIDVSGDNVPFSAAYRVVTAKDTANFWDASYNRALEKDHPIQEGDLIVGVMWVRGARLSETDNFTMDDAPEYYLALKTSTDNWGSEGGVEPSREQWAKSEWQKVFFYGNILNEEPKSSNVQLQIFLGYGNQQVDFGGIIAFWFPWTKENEMGAMQAIEDYYPR